MDSALDNRALERVVRLSMNGHEYTNITAGSSTMMRHLLCRREVFHERTRIRECHRGLLSGKVP